MPGCTAHQLDVQRHGKDLEVGSDDLQDGLVLGLVFQLGGVGGAEHVERSRGDACRFGTGFGAGLEEEAGSCQAKDAGNMGRGEWRVRSVGSAEHVEPIREARAAVQKFVYNTFNHQSKSCSGDST